MQYCDHCGVSSMIHHYIYTIMRPSSFTLFGTAFLTLAQSHQVLLTRAATNALLIVALFTIPVVTGTSQAHTTQYSLLTSFSSRQLLPCFCSMDTFSPNTLARRGFTSHIGAIRAWAGSCSKAPTKNTQMGFNSTTKSSFVNVTSSTFQASSL